MTDLDPGTGISTSPAAGRDGDLDRSRTRPGTPMVGPYSVNQMNDFYTAIAGGEVKPTGVMNLLQRLFVAERCCPGDRVVDVGCGRGLQLPVLWRYRPDLGHYTGLDVSEDNLAEARNRIADASPGRSSGFEAELYCCDVAQPWPTSGPFDVAIYTSALEHLPAEQGRASLRHTAAAMAEHGRLYLSTPNTPPRADSVPRALQHRVHVHERSHDELLADLAEAGLEVLDVVGILPPPLSSEELAALAGRQYGDGAANLVLALSEHAPSALLGPVLSTALGAAASEVLYVCARRPA